MATLGSPEIEFTPLDVESRGNIINGLSSEHTVGYSPYDCLTLRETLVMSDGDYGELEDTQKLPLVHKQS